jgi:hypothetical protein
MTEVPNPWQRLWDRHRDVLLARLPIAERGRCYSGRGLAGAVVLRTGMLIVEERATLWHEIAHLEHRDIPCLDAVLGRRQEARCWRIAARLAIPTRALIASCAWPHDEHEWADELKTTVELLTIRLDTAHPAEKAAVARRRAEREDAA